MAAFWSSNIRRSPMSDGHGFGFEVLAGAQSCRYGQVGTFLDSFPLPRPETWLLIRNSSIGSKTIAAIGAEPIDGYRSFPIPHRLRFRFSDSSPRSSLAAPFI